MSTLEERALADSDDSDRFTTAELGHGYGYAIDSFVTQTRALVKMTAERDAALAHIERLCVEALGSEHRFRGEAFVHVSDLRNAMVIL